MQPFAKFADFYRALNGREPFPWQKRLAEEVYAKGKWCAEIGIQTGLGKSSCLDIAIWWLATQADIDPAKRTAPTRIWWVVNRRLLVDATFDRAYKIQHALRRAAHRNHADCVIQETAQRLQSIAAAPEAEPLEVIRLRAGIACTRPVDPSQPAVILCTLPMYGSRLLFRGFGTTRGYRVVDAAMAGTDSLVFLDEAHLVPHLKNLFPALADCYPDARSVLCGARSKPIVVALTATGESGDESRFMLNAEDEQNSIVSQRLRAGKPLRMVTKDRHDPKHLANAAIQLLEAEARPTTCLVFANTPRTARKAFDLLAKKYREPKATVLLLTGRTREREAERIRERILSGSDGMSAERDPKTVRGRSLIVVATQTLEVGADIDAELLVTEGCGVRALTQRLGRLNRIGRFDHAQAIYVHMNLPKSNKSGRWPVYGTEPAILEKRLSTELRKIGSDSIDLSPERVASVLGRPEDDPGRAPEVLPGILWEWVKTSNPPRGEAPVEPYFAGIENAKGTAAVIWRAHLPNHKQRLWPRAVDREAIDIPIQELRDVLKELDFGILDSDGVTVLRKKPDIRPGCQIVLPTDAGLMDEFGWNPDSEEPAMDVSLVDRGLPLEAEAIRRLAGKSVSESWLKAARLDLTDSEDADSDDQAKAVQQILDRLQDCKGIGWPQDEWTRFVCSLEGGVVVHAINQVPRLQPPITKPLVPPDRSDEASFGLRFVELDKHCQDVAERAEAVAIRNGLPESMVRVLRKAGRLHDLGKADRRFQAWLDPSGVQCVRLAKSSAPRSTWEARRIEAGWPRGGRHESLSARLVEGWLRRNPHWGDSIEEALLLHLVLSHHGRGRPLILPVRDGSEESVKVNFDGVELDVSADLEETDWEQPARFRRLIEHYGAWDLALLEAILVCADHTVSSNEG